MLRILAILSLFIFIEDITGIEEENLVSDNEEYIYTACTYMSWGSGQSALMSNDRNCDAHTYDFDCSIHHALANVTNNGLIDVTTHMMLLSVISLGHLDNHWT